MSTLEQFPIQTFQEKLLYWFERNMRDLPWRKDKDPYKIWVSEVMLQQTKVDTVIPYFERFLEKFPTMESLAAAPLDMVLKEWEGLGYYSRARNLHQAVQEVQATYQGVVPDTLEEISTLKGVGSYTAGAILSIAYGKPEPAVDGNVMRVFSRLLAIEEDVLKAKTKKLFEGIVRQVIPEGRASYFNQAVMELGALICIPKSPKCELCPVQETCAAYELQIQERLPIRQRKKQSPLRTMVAAVLEVDGHVLIRQRPGQGLLARLFEFPNLEWQNHAPEEVISQYLYNKYGLKTSVRRQWSNVQHTFSHLIWDISVYYVQLVEKDATAHLPLLPVDHYWVKLEELENYAFSVSHQKIKRQLEENS